MSRRQWTSRIGPALLGVVLAFAGHVLAFAMGIFVAGLASSTGDDDGEASIGAFWIAVLSVEVVVVLACVAGGAVLVARQRHGLGIGLLLGWPLSLLAGCLVLVAQGGRSL
jgi:hypothetical protein